MVALSPSPAAPKPQAKDPIVEKASMATGAPIAMPLTKLDPGIDTHQGQIAHPQNPYFYNFVGALPEDALKDNPEIFLLQYEGKDHIISYRHDAGELYGNRLALKHHKRGIIVTYKPSPKCSELPFIKGFMKGYNIVVALFLHARESVKAVEAKWKWRMKTRPWPRAVAEEQIRNLGGPTMAACALECYLRSPEKWAKHKDVAVRMLQQCGDPALPALRRALSNGNPTIRGYAAWFFNINIGAEAIPDLVSQLRSGSRQAKEQALSALFNAHCYRALAQQEGVRELLKKFIHDRHETSRTNACWLLVCTDLLLLKRYGHLAANWRIEPLYVQERISASADDPSQISKHMAEVLALYLGLPDRPKDIRLAAVWLLGKCENAGVPALKNAAKDSDPQIRRAAAKALAEAEGWMHGIIQVMPPKQADDDGLKKLRAPAQEKQDEGKQ